MPLDIQTIKQEYDTQIHWYFHHDLDYNGEVWAEILKKELFRQNKNQKSTRKLNLVLKSTPSLIKYRVDSYAKAIIYL